MDIERASLLPLSTSTSSWSLATTKLDDPSDNSTSSSGATDQKPACWRFSDVKDILQSNDYDSIARLLRFRPFNDKFEPGLFKVEPRSDRPRITYESWNWKHYNSGKSSTEEIATAAAKESTSSFKKISFEDWVHYALGLAAESIEDFEQQHVQLSLRLYYYLRRHPDEIDKYHEVLEKLGTEGRFISATICNSFQCLSDNSYSELRMNFNSITEPLRRVLSEPLPVEYILQQLEILAIRYKLWRDAPEADWSQEFNTDTSFFSKLCQENMQAFAVELCEKDHCFFQNLTIRGIVERSDTALSSLNSRWNDLSRRVQECVGVGNTEMKLTLLAEELHRMRNFYSLTAVLQGLQLCPYRSTVLKKLHYLIDPANNYKAYRQNMNLVPALHFLFPVIRDSRNGKPLLALRALYASKLYNVQTYCCFPEMGLTLILTIMPPLILSYRRVLM